MYKVIIFNDINIKEVWPYYNISNGQQTIAQAIVDQQANSNLVLVGHHAMLNLIEPIIRKENGEVSTIVINQEISINDLISDLQQGLLSPSFGALLAESFEAGTCNFFDGHRVVANNNQIELFNIRNSQPEHGISIFDLQQLEAGFPAMTSDNSFRNLSIEAAIKSQDYQLLETLIEKYSNLNEYWRLKSIELAAHLGAIELLQQLIETGGAPKQSYRNEFAYANGLISGYERICRFELNVDGRTVNIFDLKESPILFQKFCSENLELIFATKAVYKDVYLAMIADLLIESKFVEAEYYTRYVKYLLSTPAVNRLHAKVMTTKILRFATTHMRDQITVGQYHSLMYLLSSSIGIIEDNKARTDLRMLMEAAEITRSDRVPSVELVASGKKTKKKIAVCLSGMTRGNLQGVLNNIKNTIEGDYEVDYFIHTWDQKEVYPGVGGIGRGPEQAWAKKYFQGIIKELPQSIATKSRLEAELPNIAEVIYTPLGTENTDAIFKQVLGSSLKKIVLEDNQQFEKAINTGSFKFHNNQNQAKMFYGIQRSFELMEEYQAETGENYEYVVRFRVDLLHAMKISNELFANIEDNDVLIKFTTGIGPDDRFFVAKYHTAKRIMKSWRAAISCNRLSPYQKNGRELAIDAHALLLAQLSYLKINVIHPRKNEYRPRYVERIQLPDLSAAIEQDQLAAKPDQIKNAILKLQEIYCTPVFYNQSFDNITKISTDDSHFEGASFNIIIKIEGTDLLAVYNNKINFLALNVFNYNTYNYTREYVNGIDRELKVSDTEIILQKTIEFGAVKHGERFELAIRVSPLSPIIYRLPFNRIEEKVIGCGTVYMHESTSGTLVIGHNKKESLGRKL